jgi:hypothetical protein
MSAAARALRSRMFEDYGTAVSAVIRRGTPVPLGDGEVRTLRNGALGTFRRVFAHVFLGVRPEGSG